MSSTQPKLRVGVTLSIREGAQSIWENGIFQNCVFLVQLLNLSPAVGEAVLVNTGTHAPSAGLLLDRASVRIIGLDEAAQTLDIAIEMSALLPEPWFQSFRARGGRTAWMRVGNDYVIDIERAMYNRPHAALCSNKVYDAVWTLPEYEHSCSDYFSLTARAPVRIVPHLWSPQFLRMGIDSLPADHRWGYQPGRATWRVCSFEPNMCMVKTSLIPILVCEEAYRANPAFLDLLRVCNSLALKDDPQFVTMANTLDVVSHGLASFDGRFTVYEFMAHHGDCIVSHHWENGQNYLYYEALYGGYPLVHNSEFIKGCGYYYPHFDCQAGGAALLRAYMEHDRRLDDEKRSTAALLHSVDVANPDNIEAYTRELLALYDPR